MRSRTDQAHLAAQDIDQLFATNRADVKGDADPLKAARRLLIEKVIAPYAIETSGDRPATIVCGH